jgi:aquaglyceroporin related protein
MGHDDDQSPARPAEGYSTQHETAQSSSSTSHTTARGSVARGTLDAGSSNEHPHLYRHHSVRRALGLHAKTPIDAGHAAGAHHNLFWPRIRSVLREPLAEFWGVFFMILFGNGSVAQVLLTQGAATAPGADGNGNYQSINWCWGIGVMVRP